jgi:catechol 2,3-dioxygenase-like lactoylglutathione lyase family enzyme
MIKRKKGRAMGLRFLEHVLILTHDPEGTRDWFVNNLGFRNGYHPEFGFPVYWLYIGEQDVIHIGKARHSEHQDTYLKTPTDGDKDFSAAGALGSGRIDHICLNCDGMQEFVDRLTANGVEFSERKAHNSLLYQLFMREPINGIKVELNFSWEEAVKMGRVPAYTDTGDNQKSTDQVMTAQPAQPVSTF